MGRDKFSEAIDGCPNTNSQIVTECLSALAFFKVLIITRNALSGRNRNYSPLSIFAEYTADGLCQCCTSAGVYNKLVSCPFRKTRVAGHVCAPFDMSDLDMYFKISLYSVRCIGLILNHRMKCIDKRILC